jgi:hypothetical protein
LHLLQVKRLVKPTDLAMMKARSNWMIHQQIEVTTLARTIPSMEIIRNLGRG